MMAPPQMQCLNSMRVVARKAPSLTASISTSRSLRNDEPPQNRPRRSDALADLSNLPRPSQSRNPIQLPVRGRQTNRSYFDRQPAQGNADSTARITALIGKTSRIAAKQSLEVQPTTSATAAPTTTTTTSAAEDLESHVRAAALSKQISRRFQAGDVYAPHDLSWVEMSKWRNRERPSTDAFDALDLKPLDHYRNFSMISEYITPMGRIKHSSETGLRPVNQRRIARTIRRAIGMGIMPSVHRHPEILQKILLKKQNSANMAASKAQQRAL